MDFRKLPSNSEGLLLKLVCSENPTQVLREQYNGLSTQQEQELDGIIRELKGLGYIDVKWADNEPYFVILNNSARTYSERLAEYNAHNPINATQGKKVRNTIFISHRSTDKGIADMLVDFFAGTGISKETVFCSSLPGNDINERISDEVRSALKSSAVNIAILSHDYYQSAYCLNEAGVLWYEDVPVIPVALPEINSDNMYGFLNNEYKLRRLDSDTDISYIYDTVSEAVSAPHTKASLITYENNKLRTRYAEYLKARELPPDGSDISIADTIAEITTDDERIVLYYILHENVRKVSKSTISSWLNKCEIRGVNVDNAFDLLSSFFIYHQTNSCKSQQKTHNRRKYPQIAVNRRKYPHKPLPFSPNTLPLHRLSRLSLPRGGVAFTLWRLLCMSSLRKPTLQPHGAASIKNAAHSKRQVANGTRDTKETAP